MPRIKADWLVHFQLLDRSVKMDPEDEAALLALPPPPTSLLPSSSLPLLPTDDQICSDPDVHVCAWTSSLPYSPRQPLCPPTPRQPRQGRSKRPAPPPPPPSTPLPPLPRTLGFSASSRFLDDCRAETFSECLANILKPLSLSSCQYCPSKPSCPYFRWTFLLLLVLVVVGLGLGLGLGLKGESEQVSALSGTSQALLLLGGTDGTSNRTLELVSGGTYI